MRFEQASLGYGRKPVLTGVSLSIDAGMFLGIVGPNGSGKTTLLRAILGILSPRVGQVTRAASGLRVGYVPQRSSVDPVFPLRVTELVLMGRYGRLGPFRRPRTEDHHQVGQALQQLQILDLAERLYRDLSGGQQQRVLIARALCGEPELLVLDEPTNGMDLASEQAIMDLVGSLARDAGVTVLFVTHLLNLVANQASHLALVHGGVVTLARREEMLDEHRLSAIYGIPVEVCRLGHGVVVRARQVSA